MFVLKRAALVAQVDAAVAAVGWHRASPVVASVRRQFGNSIFEHDAHRVVQLHKLIDWRNPWSPGAVPIR